MLRKKDQFIGI